jgi:hypothetical protein
MTAATLYFTSAVSPSGHDWFKGIITKQDATGVWVNTREDGRGQSYFFPMHLIQRINLNSGW